MEDERIEVVRAAFEDWYRERAALKLPPRVDRIASLLGVQPNADPRPGPAQALGELRA